MANAAMTSSSTTPRCPTLWAMLPLCPAAAIEPVGGDGECFSITGVFVFVTPGIERDAVTAKVWTVPDLNGCRLLHQGSQSLGLYRIPPDIYVEDIERTGKRLDLELGRALAGIGQLRQDARAYEGRNQPDDGQHDQHLDQREARLAAPCTLALPEMGINCKMYVHAFRLLTDHVIEGHQGRHD